MNTRKDIEGRADIEILIDAFYTKVKKDEVIGHFFTEVVQLSWEHHIPVMYNFWEGSFVWCGRLQGQSCVEAYHLASKRSTDPSAFQPMEKTVF